MVCGADTMLDMISQGRLQITLKISETPFEDTQFTLTINREDGGGAWYNVSNEDIIPEIWLCHVTKFVFNGRLPEKLFVKSSSD